jgi:hypothetical protein
MPAHRVVDLTDTTSASGPYGQHCRDDMSKVNASLNRILDALHETEKWIGPQTWEGKPAEDWQSGPWTEATAALRNLVTAVDAATGTAITGADKLDQDPNAAKNYGR